MSQRPTRITLFDDDTANDIDLESGFDKALKKKQFQGEKGRMLFEIQKFINNSDRRFTIDKKFKGDISYRKLPQSVKESTSAYSQSKDYAYNMMDDPATLDEEIKAERNRNLAILSSILTNTEYLNHKPKESNVKKLMIKRYDPQLNLGESGVEVIKEEEKRVVLNKDKNIIKLEKGVEVFNEPLPNPYLSSHQKQLKKRERERQMREKMNEVNDNMNGEVEVNIDKWKSTFQSVPTSFNLFGDDNAKAPTIIPLPDTKKAEKEKEASPNKARSLIKANKEPTEKEKEKRLLRNKVKRDKKKAKQQSIKKKEKQTAKELNNQYEALIEEQYGNAKGKEYLRYIEMIKTKGKSSISKA